MSNYNADQILNQSFDATLGALEISVEAGTPQAYGVDATGADGYATVLTVSGAKTHIAIQNTGTHPAIISLNSGTTDHFYIPGAKDAFIYGLHSIQSNISAPSNEGYGGILLIKITRGNGTYAGRFGILDCDAHSQMNRIGSINEASD